MESQHLSTSSELSHQAGPATGCPFMQFRSNMPLPAFHPPIPHHKKHTSKTSSHNPRHFKKTIRIQHSAEDKTDNWSKVMMESRDVAIERMLEIVCMEPDTAFCEVEGKSNMVRPEGMKRIADPSNTTMLEYAARHSEHDGGFFKPKHWKGTMYCEWIFDFEETAISIGH